MPTSSPKLRVAAINFLNPAPLMWDFNHPPRADALATCYALHYTQPAQCASELLDGSADLGLIPVAALNDELAIVPGCTIAARNEVRSILLLVRRSAADRLAAVRSIATDTASRSSVAYTQVIFQHFLGTAPAMIDHVADPVAMLEAADAALIIGDPALIARENRQAIEAAAGPCLWIDLAEEWHRYTGLPWVAAVWAVRPEILNRGRVTDRQLIEDLQRSRDNGQLHTEELVSEWTGRLPLPPATIRTYLTKNIHYYLDPDCIAAIRLFRALAADVQALPPLPDPTFL